MVALGVPLKSLQNAVGSEDPSDFFLIQICYFQSFSIVRVNLYRYVGFKTVCSVKCLKNFNFTAESLGFVFFFS